MLVELLRAQAYRDRGDKSLSQLRRRLRNAVGSVVANWPIEDAEARVAVALAELTDGVSGYAPFLATTAIDDTFLARVFEFLLAPTGVDRFDANRLEVEGLGYANLLQLAVILATIPDLTYEGAGSGTQSPDREFDEQSANGTNSNVTTEGESLEDERSDADRRAEMEEAAEQRIIEDDTFFANNFHAIVLLEEPEAHLHPQLQHGLVSHLKTVVQDRPEVQVIVTTHSDEIVSACDPEDLVVFRRTPNGQPISRTIKSFGLKAPRLAMARRHLDVTRSAALFAERAVLVEGTTDAIVLRAIARIWAGSDPVRARFVEALTITVVGSRIGPWLPDLLAHPGKEICARLALLQDSDGRPVPNWITKREGERFGVFLSEPTLEPSLVDGNEALFEKLFESLKIEKPWTAKEGPTPESIVKWLTGAGRQRKAILADRFSALASNRPESVSIPQHMSKLLDFLWEGFRQEHQAIEANC
ncbi:ATP-dependent nuclease [Candidatus Poriferisodalis sp.]|uniref:ATP-dependent nuclease n=1 Tax=Candidatus Poriferisodalis sp. TaxID=3101277 RepID=UPI003B0192EA